MTTKPLATRDPAPDSGSARLRRYLGRHGEVPGWLDPYSARFIAELAARQHAAGISGAVAEIGVHMGRLFILLGLTRREGEAALAIDIFGDQHLNIDGSGHGDRARFLANLARFGAEEGVSVLQRSSLEVSAADIRDRVGVCRLISIDGGHTEACTINDLHLAEGALAEAGVVILDDYFNPSWPDVSTGAARYFADPATGLRPFAITPNKLYLARPGQHGFYRAEMARAHAGFREKDSVMFGHAVTVFGVEPATHAPGRVARRWLRDSALGPALMLARGLLRPAARRGAADPARR